MNRTHKLAISVLLLVMCAALSGASAQSIAIKAGDGGSLPGSIDVGETFAVLITEDDSPVGAGTSVTFRLPYDTGDPVIVPTDSDGKARYTPLVTGTLGIRVLEGTVTVANATVEVIEPGVTKQLDRVVISPDSADLEITDTKQFSATCYATAATGDGTITGCTRTWSISNTVVGTINSSSGLFTAGGVGTATVTVTVTYEGRTRTDTAIVNVSESTETVPVDAVIALQIAVGSRPCDLHWDVSGDGKVTSLDALMILQAAAGAIEL